MRKEFINEQINDLDIFTKIDEEGVEHNYVSQRFGSTGRIGAAHFALSKEDFMVYVNYEVMVMSSKLIDLMQAEWEKQNEN
jgi:hypothetical protein